MQSYMSRRFYRRGCYDVRHNGEKGVSEGRVRVFPAVRGLRQKSRYIRTNCLDRIDFSSYYLHAIRQSDNRRHPWKKN